MTPLSLALDHPKGSKPKVSAQCPSCSYRIVMSSDTQEECHDFIARLLIVHRWEQHPETMAAEAS